MHRDPDLLNQLDETARLLALAEACVDTRDLETLLSRAGGCFFGTAQADAVAVVLPPQVSTLGPAIHVSAKSPLNALAERSLRDETVNVLESLGIDAPPSEAFVLLRGAELTPLHAAVRNDQHFPLWTRTLTCDGEVHGVLTLYGYQDWILSPANVAFLERATKLLSRGVAQAVSTAAMQVRSSEDALTGALNRRGFDDAIRREIERSKRSQRDLSMVLIDVDHFKQVNDTFGHAAGDEVLVRLVSRIQRVLRRSDFLCRLGGDEFAILLPEVAEDTAHGVAQRIVRVCEDLRVGGDTRVTLSIGVAGVNSAVTSTADLVRRADEAMYAAKRAGRGRVGRAV
jgi:diguanylate cyclase (GGDEF)-like protein